MPLPLSERHPSLHTEAIAAFERAQAASGKVTRSLGEQALPDVATLLAQKAREAKETGVLPGQAGLEQIANPETRAKFERSFDEFATLFDRIGFTMPTPEDFFVADTEIFTHWSGVYERMQENGLEPEVSITPLANTSKWRALYANLQNDATVNHDGRIKNGGIFINDDVAKNWDHLTGQTIQAAGTVITTADGTKWIIQVNPGTAEAPNGGAAYTDIDMHMSPHAYLAAQARKLQYDQQPLDEAGWSWLHGTFSAGARAPDGCWYRDDGQVNVYWNGVGDRVDGLGSRSPVG